MASLRPAVLEVRSLGDFMQYVLGHHVAPSTLVVCSSKAVFLAALQAESAPTLAVTEAGEHATDGTSNAQLSGARHLWNTPTLRLLSASRTITLAFCPDITHLRAYLATYSVSVSKRPAEADCALRVPGATPILAVFNPIQLHRPTSAFSAQGLNRTFSVAVEAAQHTGSKLLLTECVQREPILDLEDQMHSEEDAPAGNPWDEEVTILNVTTKRLGDLSVGRTVQIKTVAERWCTFETLSLPEDV